jgi:alkylhydroperoxidase/carboxymuconolactone decarboxylase family protein YurZ
MKSQSWERSWRRIALSLGACIGLSSVAFVTTVQSQNSAAYNQTVLTTLSKISASGASGQFDTAEQLFRDGKEAGLSELQMYETVLNLLPYIGYPRTLSTLGRFQKVYPNYIVKRSEGESPKPTEPWQEYATTTWGKRGMQVQEQLAGGSEANKELIQRLSQISPELAEWVRYDDFGRVFGRAGLSLIEREAIVLGTLIALGAPQISFHYKAMLRVGGDDALVDALLDGVAGIANEKALTAARQHIDAARK